MMHQAINAVKFKALARRLGLPLYRAVGLLESVWLFAQIQARDGDLSRFTPLELAGWLEWDGGDDDALIDALVETRWLDRDGESLVIHDWDQHKPNYLKGADAAAAKRQPPKGGSRVTSKDTPKDGSKTPPPNLTQPNPTVGSNVEGDHERFGGSDDATASSDLPFVIPPPNPDKALRFGNAVGKCSGPKDVELAWKLTALESVLGEAWFANITTALHTVKDPPRNRWAYARSVAALGSTERPGPGKERLAELLKRAPNPPDDWPRTRGSP